MRDGFAIKSADKMRVGLSEERFCLDSSFRRLLLCLLRNFTNKLTFRVSWNEMLIHNGIEVYFRESTIVKICEVEN